MFALVLHFTACMESNSSKIEEISQKEKNQLLASEGILYDTIVSFDPVTFKEKIEIVKRELSNEIISSQAGSKTTTIKQTGIDTIIVFDPKTYKETMTIINHDTGETITK